MKLNFFEIIPILGAVPGILASILSDHIGTINDPDTRAKVIALADTALAHQFPPALLLPEKYRSEFISHVLDLILGHANAPGKE